ncbi:hypothetical protein WOLCODRAFT_85008, partial [Wolfiporia cocos MD-104 SS10]
FGVCGESFIPRHLQLTDFLDAFWAFNVIKYTNHHVHEIAFQRLACVLWWNMCFDIL